MTEQNTVDSPGNRLTTPDRGKDKQGSSYSHSRSSGLDLVRKFSSTLVVRDAEVGGTGGALAAPGGETENHFLNKFRVGIPLSTAHWNLPSWTVCLRFTKCSEDPKVTGLLRAAEAGIREKRYELGKRQSDLMAWNPSHTIAQELPPQTHSWTARATRIVLVSCLSTYPHPQAQTWQPAQVRVVKPRPISDPPPHQPTAQLSLLAFSSALRHSRN